MASRRQEERAHGRATGADRLALFAVMWALASLWHVLGNPDGAPAWAEAALALAAGFVLWRPGPVLPLALLAAAGLVVAWEEAPTLGDEWLLASFVNLAIVVSVAVAVVRRRFADRADLAERVFPAARVCLLGAYAFAAFAKLNTAFFDRETSCAVFLYREVTDSIGLDGLQLGGTAWVDRAVILGAVGIELAIPVLLLIRRTRGVGVVLGLAFHAVLALDGSQLFVDDSAVLFALLVLFLPPSTGHWVSERVGSIRARLALRGPRLPHLIGPLLAILPTLVGLLVAVDALSADGAMDVGWWLWQLAAVGTIAVTIRLLRQAPGSSAVRLLPYHPLYALVPLLVVANGLAPYLELKTADAWNGYSNLATVDGDTNHLVLPRTVPVTDEQADLVHILDTNDPLLSAYRTKGLAMTWDELRDRLSERPEVSITYRRGARLVALEHASDDPELVAPRPLWREKLLPFRPVDLADPERCEP
jgi:hypothetical protein